MQLAGGADPLADRLARNTQSILAEEAQLFRVADPGAGSGAIEALTADLAAAAWKKFQAIEAAGGIVPRSPPARSRRTSPPFATPASAAIRERAALMVGVNAYVDERAERG